MKEALEELWEKIPGFENYLVSNYGEVVNGKTNYALSQSSDGKGYQKVNLSKMGVKTTFYVHRLVARAFLVDYNPDLTVIHKGTDFFDNSIRNLKAGKKKIRKGAYSVV